MLSKLVKIPIFKCKLLSTKGLLWIGKHFLEAFVFRNFSSKLFAPGMFDMLMQMFRLFSVLWYWIWWKWLHLLNCVNSMSVNINLGTTSHWLKFRFRNISYYLYLKIFLKKAPLHFCHAHPKPLYRNGCRIPMFFMRINDLCPSAFENIPLQQI